MEEPESLKIIYSGKSIAKNTIYNLLGYGIPLVFAVILLPFLIKGLGDERFGILNLIWIIIGYASFLDFGIGKSLTKIIAEKVSLNQAIQIPPIFWTSLFLMLSISVLSAIVLSFLIPSLVNIFNISKNVKQETINVFYILAISIPIVSTTAGLRG
ncbi:MAG TPA: oligosaccharide flippase family protein, partial [Ignavibacteriaceae bacterium]|nr:oligosaccharide flippase family protein [Ignavibacteriaceae bacterium]